MKANFLLFEKYHVFFYYGVTEPNDSEFIEDVIKFFYRNSSKIQTFPSLKNIILINQIVKIYNNEPSDKEFRRYKR
jgi:hypothetical protein